MATTSSRQEDSCRFDHRCHPLTGTQPRKRFKPRRTPGTPVTPKGSPPRIPGTPSGATATFSLRNEKVAVAPEGVPGIRGGDPFGVTGVPGVLRGLNLLRG